MPTKIRRNINNTQCFPRASHKTKELESILEVKHSTFPTNVSLNFYVQDTLLNARIWSSTFGGIKALKITTKKSAVIKTQYLP